MTDLLETAVNVERVDYPRGGHGYTVNGSRAVGVTTITGAVIPKPWLAPWAAKNTRIGLVELQKRLPDLDVLRLAEGEDVETRQKQLADWLKREKLRPDDTRDAAGDRGTAVHKLAEVYDETGRIPDPQLAHPVDRGYVASLAGFLQETKPTTLGSEVVVGSAEHLYAGTFDLRAAGTFPVWAKWEGDKPAFAKEIEFSNAILDYKTSTKVGNDHRLQLKLYDVAAMEMGTEPADGLLIVHLAANGKWKVYPSYVTAGQAVAAVTWYHAFQGIDA